MNKNYYYENVCILSYEKKIKNSTNASTFIYLRVTPAELLYAGISR